MADDIAKQGANIRFIGLETFLGVLKRQLKEEIQDWKAKKK